MVDPASSAIRVGTNGVIRKKLCHFDNTQEYHAMRTDQLLIIGLVLKSVATSENPLPSWNIYILKII